jgi:predicted nucleic acid-binding protein
LSLVFDTQALLAFYLEEPGAEKVANYLKQVLEKKISGHINIINLAELYYILSRQNEQLAEEKERNLRSFGIKIVPVNVKSGLWKQAALMKAKHPLSIADAFAAATAITLKAKLVTGSDIEFDHIENLRIERVGA